MADRPPPYSRRAAGGVERGLSPLLSEGPSLFWRRPIDSSSEDIQQIRDRDDAGEPLPRDHRQRAFGAAPHQIRRLTDSHVGRPGHDVPGHGVLDFRDAFRLSGLQRSLGQNPHDLTAIYHDEMVEAPQAHYAPVPAPAFPRA